MRLRGEKDEKKKREESDKIENMIKCEILKVKYCNSIKYHKSTIMLLKKVLNILLLKSAPSTLKLE